MAAAVMLSIGQENDESSKDSRRGRWWRGKIRVFGGFPEERLTEDHQMLGGLLALGHPQHYRISFRTFGSLNGTAAEWSLARLACGVFYWQSYQHCSSPKNLTANNSFRLWYSDFWMDCAEVGLTVVTFSISRICAFAVSEAHHTSFLRWYVTCRLGSALRRFDLKRDAACER